MSLREDLQREIDKGLAGKSGTIPLPYERLGDYIDICKNTMYIIAAESGVGKSTMAQDLFIISTIKWYLEHKNKVDIKLSVVYFGMERKLYMYTSRWLSRLIFENEGIYIASKKILGRYRKNGQVELMTKEELELVDRYIAILDDWEEDDILIAHEGSKNPSGLSKWLEEFAKKHGEIKAKETKGDMNDILGSKTYIPNHPNHIVLVITDHLTLISPEREEGKGPRKVRLDKFSMVMREIRDLYGFSPVIAQQLNRNISDVNRKKMGDVQPKLSDMGDTSDTTRDADVIIAIHDPYRHLNKEELHTAVDNGFQLKDFQNERGDSFYRTLHIIKNSFDTNGLKISIALDPYTGIIKSLPRKDNITPDIYQRVISRDYFL